MKLYTRGGDDGSTGLYGGARVGKDDPRVEAYGTVDELNASLGLAAAACDRAIGLHGSLLEMLSAMQSRLFDIGAGLATPDDPPKGSDATPVREEDVTGLETWIDEVDGGNAPMRHFILPGGSEIAARLHVARTICRRAERRLVSLSRDHAVDSSAIKYLNRVSDLLFAMARRCNREAGVEDVPWRGTES